jgi:hypothetical protein
VRGGPSSSLRLLLALGCWLGFGAAAGCGGNGGAAFGGSGAPGGPGGSASGNQGGSSGSGAGQGGDAGPSCPKLTACGGDVAGEWTARQACLVALDPHPEPGCEGAKSYSAEVTGSYRFDASSKTLSTNVTIAISELLAVNDACARSIAVGARTAAEACPYLEAEKQADPSYESVSCQVDGAICHCVLEEPAVPQRVANSYTLAGSRIIDSNGDPVDYCVAGDELGIYAVSGDFGLTLWFDRK